MGSMIRICEFWLWKKREEEEEEGISNKKNKRMRIGLDELRETWLNPMWGREEKERSKKDNTWK